jgi:hypothetical protein
MFGITAPRPAVGLERSVQIVLLIFSCLVAASCGTKSYPRAVHKELSPQVNDLQAQVHAKGVELSWTFPEELLAKGKHPRYQFAVQRAEVKWENRNCQECPVILEDKEVIDPAHPAPALLDRNKFSWVDTNVSRGHAYRYRIETRSDKGRAVALSNTIVTKIQSPPVAPGRVAAMTETKGILVRWQKPTKDLAGMPLQGQLRFVVERQPSGSPQKWENISPVPIDGIEYLDQTVASSQAYDYRVFPILIFEETNIWGEPSLIQLVKAPDTSTPPPPQSVWIIPKTGNVEVHWTESEGKVFGYHVYRREGEQITRLTANPIKHPPYTDNSTKKSEVYFYAVSAVSASPQHQEGLLSKWVEIRNVSFY